MPRQSQVFIDEFQDFTEVQIFLMGEVAETTHGTVTIAGDFAQRLARGHKPSIDACFPRAAERQRVPKLLLENKRQVPGLAALAALYRRDILEDEIDVDGQPANGLLHLVPALDHVPAVRDMIVARPPHESIVIICPNSARAEELENALRDDLYSTRFRETRVSSQSDLIKPYYVHFTTALQAKGLEFDTAIVAYIEEFDIQDEVMANRLYVAITRPRENLMLVGTVGRVDSRVVQLFNSTSQPAVPDRLAAPVQA
jgi:superfamily I DNA/RNA helicase